MLVVFSHKNLKPSNKPYPGVLRLPSWSAGMCLMEYIPEATERINAQLLEASEAAQLRRDLIGCLSASLGAPLELDSITFRLETLTPSSTSSANTRPHPNTNLKII